MGGRTGRTARKSPIQPKNIVIAPPDPLGLVPEVHVQTLDLRELSAKEAGGFLKAIVERNTFEGKIAPLEKFARKVWKEAGLPEFDSWKVIPLPDGGDGTPIKLVENRPYTPEWYAAWILRGTDFVRLFLRRGEADAAVVEALRLGSTISEAGLRDLWATDTVLGRRVRKGGQKGAAETHSPARRAERARRDTSLLRDAARIAKDNPGISYRKLAGRVAPTHGVSASTARRLLSNQSRLASET